MSSPFGCLFLLICLLLCASSTLHVSCLLCSLSSCAGAYLRCVWSCVIGETRNMRIIAHCIAAEIYAFLCLSFILSPAVCSTTSRSSNTYKKTNVCILHGKIWRWRIRLKACVRCGRLSTLINRYYQSINKSFGKRLETNNLPCLKDKDNVDVVTNLPPCASGGAFSYSVSGRDSMFVTLRSSLVLQEENPKIRS